MAHRRPLEVLGSNPRNLWGREQGTETRTLLSGLYSPTPGPNCERTGPGAAGASRPLSLPAARGALGGPGWGAMRGNRVGSGSPKAPLVEGGSRTPGRALSERPISFKPAAGASDALTAVGTARPGPGGARVSAGGLATPGGLLRVALLFRFVIKGRVLLLDVRKVTQPLVFLSSPRTLSFPCTRRQSLVIPKEACFQLCPPTTTPKCSCKGGHPGALLWVEGKLWSFIFLQLLLPLPSLGAGYWGCEKLGRTPLP